MPLLTWSYGEGGREGGLEGVREGEGESDRKGGREIAKEQGFDMTNGGGGK